MLEWLIHLNAISSRCFQNVFFTFNSKNCLNRLVFCLSLTRKWSASIQSMQFCFSVNKQTISLTFWCSDLRFSSQTSSYPRCFTPCPEYALWRRSSHSRAEKNWLLIPSPKMLIQKCNTIRWKDPEQAFSTKSRESLAQAEVLSTSVPYLMRWVPKSPSPAAP